MIYYKLPMVDFMANEAGISGSLLADLSRTRRMRTATDFSGTRF